MAAPDPQKGPSPADGRSMDGATWTRETLLALASGKRVMMRAPDATDMAVPDWLAAVASEVSTHDSSQSLDVTHPDDRSILVDSFLRSAVTPWEPCTCRIRIHLDDEWRHDEVTWVNLVEHPDVGGLLCVVENVDGPEIVPPPPADVSSEHTATNWMILTLGSLGEVAATRGALTKILGFEPDEILGRTAADLIHPECVVAAIENWVELRSNPDQTRTSRHLWRHKDGSGVWLESSFLVHHDDTVEAVMVDISDRVANEEALAASQAELAALAEDFRLVADEVPMPVFRCDADGRLEFRNAQWVESFPEHSETELLHEVVDPADHEALSQLLAEVSTGDGGSEPIEVAAADGPRVLGIRCRAVGADPDRRRIVGSINDVTATVHLRHQANHDALTGLANRPMITAQLAAAVAEDPEGTLVLFIDLDGFKEVNDDHGHDAGDAVLVELARRLTGTLRPGDHVGRYGGDEFVVVCRGVHGDDDALIADRVRAQAFTEPIRVADASWQPSASIGISRPERGADVADVLHCADHAMFEAKRGRR